MIFFILLTKNRYLCKRKSCNSILLYEFKTYNLPCGCFDGSCNDGINRFGTKSENRH